MSYTIDVRSRAWSGRRRPRQREARDAVPAPAPALRRRLLSSTRYAAWLLAGCEVGPSPAAGGLPPIAPNRPTFSDGTALVPVDHAQLETGYTFARQQQAGVVAERHVLPEIVARYRPAAAIELRLLWGGEVWSDVDGGSGGSRDVGGSDLGVAMVLPVVAQQGALPTVAVELASTLGIGADAVGSGHADPTAKLLWSYAGGELPDWLGIGGNFDVAYPTEQGDRFTQTSASAYATISPGRGDTSVFAEWYVIGRPANGVEASQSCDFGVVQRLSDRVAVDARAGFGLDQRADDFFAGVGISFLF